jgi:hypothetical protein
MVERKTPRVPSHAATAITPPQQALDWILDLYDSEDDIRAWGQTIVYTVHEHVGHLGIFVSGGVARKEHDEFASNIDLIDVLPPGLYEAVLTPRGEAVANPDLVAGECVMRCEARTLADVRAGAPSTRGDSPRSPGCATPIPPAGRCRSPPSRRWCASSS